MGIYKIVRNTRSRLAVISLVAAVALPLLSPTAARATLITFVHEGVGAGTLNGVPFPSSAFTITATGDTDDRLTHLSYLFEIPHLSSSISIAGVGDFDFVSETYSFVNNNTQTVGFSTPGRDLFDGPTNPAFASWDMLSAIGPFSGSGILIQWGIANPIQTSGGILRFNSTANVPTTFQAIPEPSVLSLLAMVGTLIATHRHPRRGRM